MRKNSDSKEMEEPDDYFGSFKEKKGLYPFKPH